MRRSDGTTGGFREGSPMHRRAKEELRDQWGRWPLNSDRYRQAATYLLGITSRGSECRSASRTLRSPLIRSRVPGQSNEALAPSLDPRYCAFGAEGNAAD